MVQGSDGTPLLKAKQTGRGGGINVEIPRLAKLDRSALTSAFAELLDLLEKNRPARGHR
jgi:hypothetical protein